MKSGLFEYHDAVAVRGQDEDGNEKLMMLRAVATPIPGLVVCPWLDGGVIVHIRSGLMLFGTADVDAVLPQLVLGLRGWDWTQEADVLMADRTLAARCTMLVQRHKLAWGAPPPETSDVRPLN